ncbi:MAG: hypothetical protein K0B87_03070, partial [Candidatus Syntrophosphaera sp.]|nr:hypothetical protein [Candidatus Syntrophosphaera sp.]
KYKMHSSPEDINGWKGAYFDGPYANDGTPTAFFSPDDPSMWVANEFTLVLFFKADQSLTQEGHPPAALIWMPSDEPPNSLNYPSIGIWYQDNQMHFGAGLDGGTELFEVTMEWDWRMGDVNVSNPGSDREPWDFVGMTFSQEGGNSVLKVYTKRFKVINGEVILLDVQDDDFASGVNAPGPIIKTQEGVSHGAIVTKVDYGDYHLCDYDWFFKGKMDRSGLYNYALTADEIDAYFWNNVITSSQVTYIRD